ncbi:MAG: hypothetical protein U0V64_11975 [Cyclobacteriaceae bacterium]
MKYVFLFCVLTAFFSCTRKSTYTPADLVHKAHADSLLTHIIAHVFTAPPYVSMSDRLKAEHFPYYRSIAFRFELDQLFIDKSGLYYYLVQRPGNKTDERRAVGGTFRLEGQSQLLDFREVFVTPILPFDELQTRSRFLFDEMVKGTIKPYLAMTSYVQWPNAASYYDSVSYEWKLRPEVVKPDSLKAEN